ncbi:MAG TPA: rRNA maturation RNase YbeY [Cyclobacteriaceae bacterium]|nr:rRNA maturation RNase YbeY [Cyclobacteriaceae bacterium]
MAANSRQATIHFDYFKTTFRLKDPKKTRAWIEQVVKAEGARIASLSYVFCTDAYLLKINREYLNHDTLTDIITFEYSEKGSGDLEGEIYISVPRVKENARKMGTGLNGELHRVIIHGVLHLLGYGDKTRKEKEKMRGKEEEWLRVLEGEGVPRETRK